MNHSSRLWLLVLIFSLLFLGACANAENEAPQINAEQITSTLLQLEDQLHLEVDELKCDLNLIADGKPTFVSNGFVVQQAQELREMCVDLVAPRTGASWDNDFVEVHVLSEKSAYVVRKGTYTINFKERDTQVVEPVITTIWQLIDGDWKMVHLHESSVDLF